VPLAGFEVAPHTPDVKTVWNRVHLDLGRLPVELLSPGVPNDDRTIDMASEQFSEFSASDIEVRSRYRATAQRGGSLS
jgi:hypothetical protein